MKIILDWVTATPDITTGGALTGFDEEDMNQVPDSVVLSERAIFTGTEATFTLTTSKEPHDIVLFDFLGNKVEVTVTYTANGSSKTTDPFTPRDQLITPVNEWSTTFRTQSTNEWIDLDHINTFDDADDGTDYEIEFTMETTENDNNDIKGSIDTWDDGSFNADAKDIPLGSRIKFDGTDDLFQVTGIFGSGMSSDSVTLVEPENDTTVPTSSTTIENIYRPISVSKVLVSTNTLNQNNPHWGMSRKRNVVQSSHNMHRGRLIPLHRSGLKYDSYTLTSGFQDDMSQDFIDFLQADGTSARPMHIVSDNATYEKREYIIFGQFAGLPTETIDARNHRVWAMDINAGII